MTTSLPQAIADDLLLVRKRRGDTNTYAYPSLGGRLNVPLESEDGREEFFLDITRNRIDLKKTKHQNRSRSVIILARLDTGHQPHENPDGQIITGPHIHLYREGFGSKWAFPVPAESFTNLDDPWQTYNEFLAFINVIEPPDIQKGLWPC